MAKKKVNKLHDVEVQAVGLVPVGANEEQFYLLKSQDTEDTIMSDQVVENVAETEVSEEVVDNFATRLVKAVAARFAANPQAEAVVTTPVQEEEVVEKAPEAEAVATKQPEVKTEEVAKAAEPVVDDRDVLMKANVALVERLELVEKELKEKRDEAERVVYVEKAKTFAHVGVDAAALADNLHFLAKADQTRYEFWTGLLTAVEARSKDAGLFEEIGKSAEPEVKDFEATLIDLIKSGDSKSIGEKLASMNRDDAESYLDSRRAAMKK